MKLQTFLRIVTTLALLCTAVVFVSEDVHAQVIDFSQIDAFESMGTGALHGASQPKTIIGDSEQHTVFITIWESDTDTKVYWKSPDGNLLERPSYMEQARTHFKPLENLGLKPSVTQITVSTMDTCCFVIKNNRNV